MLLYYLVIEHKLYMYEITYPIFILKLSIFANRFKVNNLQRINQWNIS